MTILTRPTPIDVNLPETWPESLRLTVEELDRNTVQNHYISDLSINEEDNSSISAALEGRDLVARHFTRLLPHEIDSIKSTGLRTYSQELFDQRIDDAGIYGYFDEDTARQLKASTIPAAKDRNRGDRNFRLRHSWSCAGTGSVRRLRATRARGAKEFFFAAGAKRNRAVLRFLTQQSRPAVVKVHLLVSAASQLGFYPPIANLLLGRFREMPGVQDDVFSRAAVMPDSISAIEFLERR